MSCRIDTINVADIVLVTNRKNSLFNGLKTVSPNEDFQFGDKLYLCDNVECSNFGAINEKIDNSVIIAGSRSIIDYDFVIDEHSHVFARFDGNVTIISGGAKGADAIGEKIAKYNPFGYDSISLLRVIPNWKIGKHAGHQRNYIMSLLGKSCVILHDGVSPGSKHMLKIAKKNGCDVTYVRVKEKSRYFE